MTSRAKALRGELKAVLKTAGVADGRVFVSRYTQLKPNELPCVNIRSGGWSGLEPTSLDTTDLEATFNIDVDIISDKSDTAEDKVDAIAESIAKALIEQTRGTALSLYSISGLSLSVDADSDTDADVYVGMLSMSVRAII